VLRTAALSPGFRRLTLGGEQLGGFASPGPADHVTLVFGEGETQVRRDFTPRAFRANDGYPELDIDVFLHGDGVASGWAAKAEVDFPVIVGGPRGSRLIPTGITRIILSADESALPALARWIEMADEDVEIFAFVELNHQSDAAYLEPAHVQRARVVWLDSAEHALERAVRNLGPIDDDTFVWMAGEATNLIPVRRYLRRNLELTAAQVTAPGYWKRGDVGHDHHVPVDPSDPED